MFPPSQIIEGLAGMADWVRQKKKTHYDSNVHGHAPLQVNAIPPQKEQKNIIIETKKERFYLR